jgi:hypothetical protein
MAWSKMKTKVVAKVGIFIAAGTTVAVLETKAQTSRTNDFVADAILHPPLTQKLLTPQTNDSETMR